jgi:putative redox protein
MSVIIATSTVDSTEGFAQHIEVGGHRLTADEPVSNGGTNTGPAPYGLLLSALGACTSITLRMYAARKGWSLGAVHVTLRHLKAGDGADHIERELRFGAPLNDEQRAKLAEIAEKTPVTKTVKAGAAITTRIV